MNIEAKKKAARLGRELVVPARLVLAVKTAVAAAIAWYLAPFVPFAESEYSYYAPLGVLVSMYSTVLDSARSGVQALIGLSVGIGLGMSAVMLVRLGAPAIVVVALVVGVGVAVGGLQLFGVGREWVPIAGLFVLLLSGGDASEFSVSYLVTMAFGVVVGVLVQLIAIPPLYVREAQGHLSGLRQALCSCLLETARAIGGESNSKDSLRLALDHLTVTSASVTDEIQEARRSVRANPRARRRQTERTNMDDQFQALEYAVLYVRTLCDFAEELRPEAESGLLAPGRDLLVEALLQCRALINGSETAPPSEELKLNAWEALDKYVTHIRAEGGYERAAAENEITIAVCLRRAIEVLS